MKYLLYILLIASNIFAEGKNLKRSDLGLLSFSKIEVENIRDIFPQKMWNKSGTNILLGDEISKSDLLASLDKYDVIHLATHTQIDNKNPMLTRFFISNKSDVSDEESSIFVSDIYPLRLNAKMAVLSSCNTGTGELLNGEGIMSLARAFKFAGCPSIVMSLWEIDDISTSKIMKNFYTQLRNGENKDVALREAKLAYLKNSNSKSAAPVFWAGTVPIGNLEKLTFKNGFSYNSLMYGFAALLFLLTVYYIIRKRVLS